MIRQLLFGRTGPRHPVPSGKNALLMAKDWPFTSARAVEARSYFGGDPVLPTSYPWPMTTYCGTRTPMHFLAQIDLAELPDFADRALLPDAGRLAFFAYMHEEHGCDSGDDPPTWAVYYDRGTTPAQVRSPPPETTDIFVRADEGRALSAITDEERENLRARYRKCPMTFLQLRTIPDPISKSPEPQSSNANSSLVPAIASFRSQMAANFEAALGPARPPELACEDDPAWPETVFQAREAVESWQWIVRRGNVPMARIKAFEEGRAREFADWQDLTDDEIEKRVEKIRRELPDPPLDPADDLRSSLDAMNDLDRPTEGQMRRVRDVANLSEHFKVRFSQDGSPKWRCPAGDCAVAVADFAPFEDIQLGPSSLGWLQNQIRDPVFNKNQLLGFPWELQMWSNELALNRLVALGWASPHTRVDQIRLLAQFDTSYTGVGFMFADCGKAYFYIHEDDLAAHRFERSVMIISGG